MRATLADATSDPEHDLPTIVARRRAEVETAAVLRKADALVAQVSCPKSSRCCSLAQTGRPPWLWPSEWWLLTATLARAGRPLPPPRDDGACPFLDDGGRSCSVYASRPLGCRTYFCHMATGRQPDAAAVDTLLHRLASLNLALDSRGAPRPLTDWCQANCSP